MQRTLTVNLGSLILSLSDAMDLASPFLIQHQQRTAFIVWKMGRAAGLSQKKLEDVFIAALIHDIGAFSLEEKVRLRNAEIVNPSEHCIRGQLLLNPIPWLENSGRIIRYHHTEWQSWDESIDDTLVFKSQMVVLADCLERSIKHDVFILHQHPCWRKSSA